MNGLGHYRGKNWSSTCWTHTSLFAFFTVLFDTNFLCTSKKTVTLLPLDNIMHEWEKWGIIIVIVIHMYIEDYLKAKCRARYQQGRGIWHACLSGLWNLFPFPLPFFIKKTCFTSFETVAGEKKDGEFSF